MNANSAIDEADSCPICKSSWIGTPIPYESQAFFGGKKHFGRLIGIELPHYDGVSQWQCPDCNATWDRWTHKLISEGPGNKSEASPSA